MNGISDSMSGNWPSLDLDEASTSNELVNKGRVHQLTALFEKIQEDNHEAASTEIKKKKIKRTHSEALLTYVNTANKKEVQIEPLNLAGDRKSIKRGPLSDNHRNAGSIRDNDNQNHDFSKIKKKGNSTKHKVSLSRRLKKACKEEMGIEVLKGLVMEECGLELEQRRQSPCTVNFVAIIQNMGNSGKILSPIIERLQNFYSVIERFIEEKKVISKNMSFVSDLCSLLIKEPLRDSEPDFEIVKGKKIKEFLDNWTWLCQGSTSKKIVRDLSSAFGKTKKECEEVLEYLRGWLDPSGEFLRRLAGNADQNFGYSGTISNLKAGEHHWIEDLDSPHSIFSVIPFEIIRCLHNGSGIPMNSLTINQKELHNRNRYQSENDEESLTDRWQFFSDIVREIMRGLYSSVEEELLTENVDLFRGWSECCSENRSQIVFPEGKDDQWLNVLRAMSNSCWGSGDDYMRELFPGLFYAPYWCRQIPGIDLELEIRGPDNFLVRHRRSYSVYHREGLDDNSESTIVDKNKPLCSIDFIWSVKLVEGRWQGVLKIDDFRTDYYGNDDENIRNIGGALQFVLPAKENREEFQTRVSQKR